jgi:hypothetical protein
MTSESQCDPFLLKPEYRSSLILRHCAFAGRNIAQNVEGGTGWLATPTAGFADNATHLSIMVGTGIAARVAQTFHGRCKRLRADNRKFR